MFAHQLSTLNWCLNGDLLANVVFNSSCLKEKLPIVWCLFLTCVLLFESLEICAHVFLGTPFVTHFLPPAV